ncbi:MAG: hypothetical protein J2P17_32770, partial [Mycobacterium sp.]|nr:hypothetical protein [Mycobacterium sp.]
MTMAPGSALMNNFGTFCSNIIGSPLGERKPASRCTTGKTPRGCRAIAHTVWRSTWRSLFIGEPFADQARLRFTWLNGTPRSAA